MWLRKWPCGATPEIPAPSYAQPAEPVPAPTPEQESYCREIIMDVVIDGVEQQAYGTACREPDGSWKIKNGSPSRRHGAASTTSIIRGASPAR